MGGVLNLLRGNTAEPHRRLDQLVEPDHLADVAVYSSFVAGLVSAAAVVDDWLAAAPDHLFPVSLPYRTASKRRAIVAERAFLEHDLGVRVPAARASVTDSFLADVGTPTRGAVLGVLYVSVGSGLGGGVLHRVVRSARWWVPERAALLRPYGSEMSARWRSLLQALDELPVEEHAAAVRAAQATFHLHLALLDRLVPGPRIAPRPQEAVA